MLSVLQSVGPGQEHHRPGHPREGDLFKVITVFGATFEIKYGFYDERDRHTLFAEPVAIYPNFLEHPRFTDDGKPFVTEMQEPCPCFNGRRDENSGCGDCVFYNGCEELIGICKYPRKLDNNVNLEVTI